MQTTTRFVFITYLLLVLFIITLILSSCSHYIHPDDRAKQYNYNENQAHSIINYTSKHKKQRHRIAEYNRKVYNERNSKSDPNRNPSQDDGAFKIYKTN